MKNEVSTVNLLEETVVLAYGYNQKGEVKKRGTVTGKNAFLILLSPASSTQIWEAEGSFLMYFQISFRI